MNMLTRNGNLWGMNFGVPSMERLMRRMFDLAGADGSAAGSRMELEVRDADVLIKMPAAGCTPDNFDIEVVRPKSSRLALNENLPRSYFAPMSNV